MRIRITRLRPDIELPQYATDGSAAFDLSSAESSVIPPKGTALLPTGLVIATPPGFVLLVAPRSSLFKKKGLQLGNSIGVIDQDYCGPTDELKIFVWNPGDQPVAVEKGERLAQGFFVAIAKAEWEEGEANDRSRGGWGSTGGYSG